MEQGDTAFSTPVPAGQDAAALQTGNAGRDAAITKMLTSPNTDASMRELTNSSPPLDLADACVEQVNRLAFWDGHPNLVSEDAGDAEMDRWDLVFRRAIEEPSTDLRVMAGKAMLMLADLNRFHPEDHHPTDDFKLMRVILTEVIAIGETSVAAGVDWRGQPRAAEPASLGLSAYDRDRHEYAFHGASTALRLAARELDRVCVRLDEMPDESSAEAIAAAEAARDAASARQEQAWRDLFKIRPRTNHQLWLLLRDVAQHFEANRGIVDEPDVFGALVGAADSLRLASREITAPHDLTVLTIAHLGELADVCRRQSKALYDVSGSWCEGPLTAVLDGEHDRISLLGSMASAEIERRTPADNDERNERLEALIKADLSGNGYIEPALLAEAVAAWGTR